VFAVGGLLVLFFGLFLRRFGGFGSTRQLSQANSGCLVLGVDLQDPFQTLDLLVSVLQCGTQKVPGYLVVWVALNAAGQEDGGLSFAPSAEALEDGTHAFS
jgi:hypothetical protein